MAKLVKAADLKSAGNKIPYGFDSRSGYHPLPCKLVYKLNNMKNYYSTHCVDYEPTPNRCYLELDVLPQLKGKLWDELTLALVHSTRPSCIRVTTGRCTLDSVLWRVTVYVDDKGIIRTIRQEVECAPVAPITTGHHLHVALEWGLGSPQERFFREDPDNPIAGVSYGPEGRLVKTLQDGTHVSYPRVQES